MNSSYLGQNYMTKIFCVTLNGRSRFWCIIQYFYAVKNFIANQNNQMLQAQRKKSYRISENRRRMSHAEAAKGVIMHIDSPVLEQYNNIDLGATLRSHRINHKSLSTSASVGPENSNKFKTKWETLVDRYIQSKQKIQQKKGNANSSFQFLKLDRTNRFRYIRLAQNLALPPDLTRICNMTQQITIETQKGLHRLKTDYPVTAYTKQSKVGNNSGFQLQNSRQPSNMKERMIEYFVQKYFRNKYKKYNRESSLPIKNQPDRSSYYKRSLMRNNID